jgi:hypothetical protein
MIQRRTSALISIPITIVLVGFAYQGSLGLAHSDGPQLVGAAIVLAPIFLMFLLELTNSFSEAAFVSIAVGAQFIYVYALVHIARQLYRKMRSNPSIQNRRTAGAARVEAPSSPAAD